MFKILSSVFIVSLFGWLLSSCGSEKNDQLPVFTSEQTMQAFIDETKKEFGDSTGLLEINFYGKKDANQSAKIGVIADWDGTVNNYDYKNGKLKKSRVGTKISGVTSTRMPEVLFEIWEVELKKLPALVKTLLDKTGEGASINQINIKVDNIRVNTDNNRVKIELHVKKADAATEIYYANGKCELLKNPY